MKKELVAKVTRQVTKIQNWGKKNAPELLIAGSIVGIAGGVVLACRATVKSIPVLEEAKEELHEIKNPKLLHEVTVNENGEAENALPVENVKKETFKVYGKTALKVVRAYAPAAVLLTFSVGGIIGSHKILQKRNIALAAAYTTLDTSFKDYRGRVADRYGAEVESDIYNNFTTEKITVETTDEDGNTTKSKEKVKVGNENLPTPFARYFSPKYSCYAKDGNSDWNYGQLLSTQNFATMDLRTHGTYTMAQLYRELGFEITPESLVVGWVFDEMSEDRGDNVVDLGITECYLKDENGNLQKTYMINPNYDGYIADRI